MKLAQDRGLGVQALAIVKGLFATMHDSRRFDADVEAARLQLIGLVTSNVVPRESAR
jgi:hypothetical protein